MPHYQYHNPKTGEIKCVEQRMNDKHEYIENGELWERLYDVPAGYVDKKAGWWAIRPNNRKKI